MRLIDSQLLLCRRQCAERRQYLCELERLAQRLRADGGRLCAQIAQIAQAVADGDRPAAGLLSERHQKVERSLAEIDEQVAAAGVVLAEAEQELLRRERAFAHHSNNATHPERNRAARRDRQTRNAASPPGVPERR